MALFPFYTHTQKSNRIPVQVTCNLPCDLRQFMYVLTQIVPQSIRTRTNAPENRCFVLRFASILNECAQITAKNRILAHYEKLAFLELSPPVLPQCQPWDGWPLPTWSFFQVRALGLHEWLGARWRHSHVCAQKPPFPARALKVRHCKLDFQSACGDDLIGCMHSENIFKWCKIRR